MNLQTHHMQRISQQYTDGCNTIEKVWAGACEFVTKNGQQYKYTYLSGPLGLFAIHIIKPDGTAEINYIHTDHLGSWNTITDESGNLLQELSFDAWGNRRDPQTWRAFTTTAPDPLFDRGFTGHEHLYAFNLINMNGRFYDPILGRMLSPDNYIQAPDFSQSFNRYSYCWNNPLKYVDPSGELIWLIPNIGWSKSGGLNIGLTFMVGIPGFGSAQASVGYSFKSNDFNASVGATALFNTVYASYSTQSGFSVGWTAGLSPQMGFPISTNFTSVGVNYNITHDSWSGNISAWQIDKNGMTFNPSVSVMILPEHTTNLVRGGKFLSNNNMYEYQMTSTDMSCQDILDYYGIKAAYDPSKTSTAFVDPSTGKSYFGDYPFKGNFDRFSLIADHEMRHMRDVSKAIRKGKNPKTVQFKNETEWNAYSQNYRKQGLYPDSGEISNVVDKINVYGVLSGKYNSPLAFGPRWWHFIYKIPRKW